MRLSDAILLGDSLKKADPNVWLTEDGSCGCAFGGALLAAGVNSNDLFLHATSGALRGVPLSEFPVVKSLWPWVTTAVLWDISSCYFAVTEGRMTIEELVDYVRSFEPAEQDSALRSDAPEEQYAPALANGTEERDFALSSQREEEQRSALSI